MVSATLFESIGGFDDRFIERSLLALNRFALGVEIPSEDPQFLLDPNCLPRSLDPEGLMEAARIMLEHVRSHTTEVKVPPVTPAVAFRRLDFGMLGRIVGAGGLIPLIELDDQCVSNPDLAHAALAHELSHAVLGHNTVQGQNWELERLTDLFVYCSGLGRIHLAGQARTSYGYQDGRSTVTVHHAAYLSPRECAWSHVRTASQRGLSRRDILAGLPSPYATLADKVIWQVAKLSLPMGGRWRMLLAGFGWHYDCRQIHLFVCARCDRLRAVGVNRPVTSFKCICGHMGVHFSPLRYSSEDVER